VLNESTCAQKKYMYVYPGKKPVKKLLNYFQCTKLKIFAKTDIQPTFSEDTRVIFFRLTNRLTGECHLIVRFLFTVLAQVYGSCKTPTEDTMGPANYACTIKKHMQVKMVAFCWE
jgi:hypothetical protein